MGGRCKHGARIDFHRGTSHDDLSNDGWRLLPEDLPIYSDFISMDRPGLNGENTANMMGLLAVIAFAAATDGVHLRPTSYLEWHNKGQQVAWAEVWWFRQDTHHLGPAQVRPRAAPSHLGPGATRTC